MVEYTISSLPVWKSEDVDSGPGMLALRDETGLTRWHVLHARPRCEKKLAGLCAARGILYYLPLRLKRTTRQRRRIEVEMPLFPGYLFAAVGVPARDFLRESGLLARLLPPPLRCEDLLCSLEQVRRALRVDAALGACAAFTRGQRVRILSGPFQGIEGVVQTVKGATRVILNVEMIGRGVAVEADTATLEPIR